MQTTLLIDDDILSAVEALAREQNKSVGEVISALARQALHPKITGYESRNDVPLLPQRYDGPQITLDLVNRLREEFGG